MAVERRAALGSGMVGLVTGADCRAELLVRSGSGFLELWPFQFSSCCSVRVLHRIGQFLCRSRIRRNIYNASRKKSVRGSLPSSHQNLKPIWTVMNLSSSKIASKRPFVTLSASGRD
jgi:hypothetical protein